MRTYLCFLADTDENTAIPTEALTWQQAAQDFLEARYRTELGDHAVVRVRCPDGALRELDFDIEFEISFFTGMSDVVEPAYTHPRREKGRSE